MTRKQRRLSLIGIGIGVLALAAGLVLYAMRDTLVFFRMPSEIAEKGVAPGTRFRLGGLVEPGSIERSPNQNVSFAIMDANGRVPVRYHGILPDLFREGQGVVAEGSLNGAGEFTADSVLAKHDETYMPREVADALRKQGVWQGGSGPGQPASAQPASPQPASAQPASVQPASGPDAPSDKPIPSNKTSER